MSVFTNQEFDGGYCRTDAVSAVIDARRVGEIGKAELRVFFALLEHKESGERAPLDVILNKGRCRVKRMTSGQQAAARQRLTLALETHKTNDEPYGVKIPRKFVRAAAKGQLEVSEMITALCYFQRRMPQRSKRKCLVRGERYGRLSVRTVRKHTGLCFGVIVKAIRRLRQIGLLALVWRPMVEVKRWGRLFVDGLKVSVSYHEPEQSRSSAPSARLRNTGTVPAKKPNEEKITLPKNSLNRFRALKSNGNDAIEAFAARFGPTWTSVCSVDCVVAESPYSNVAARRCRRRGSWDSRCGGYKASTKIWRAGKATNMILTGE